MDHHLAPRAEEFTAGMTVSIEAGRPSGRVYHSLTGWGVGSIVHVPANNVRNAIVAVSHRVLGYYDKTAGALTPVLKPEVGAFIDLAPLTAEVARTVRDTCHVAPMTLREFVATCRTGVRKRYQRAMEWYLGRGMTERDAEVKVFVKYEKLGEKEVYGQRGMAIPRVISPRGPVYNLRLGCYLRPVEKRIYDALFTMFATRFGTVEPVVTKGQDLFQKADGLKRRWDRFRRPVGVGLDQDKFDQHFSKEALECEHSVYNQIYSGDATLRWLLSKQLKNVCSGSFVDGWLRYEVEGVRMSGDMNTSLGNCLTSCLLLYHLLDGLGVSKCEVANDGDDVMVVIDEKELHKLGDLGKGYERFGFRATVEPPVYVFEQMEYCSARPVALNARECVMVRGLAGLQKDLNSLACNDVKTAGDWFAAVGEANLATQRGVPMFSSLYGRFTALGDAEKGRKSKLFINSYHYEGCGAEKQVVVDEVVVRSSFAAAYDIMPDAQLSFERAVMVGERLSGDGGVIPNIASFV